MPRSNRIESSPKIMLGKPVIRGTRIPVELVLRKLSEGATEADVPVAYPRLKRTDIHAALEYAAGALAHDEFIVEPRRRRTGSQTNAIPLGRELRFRRGSCVAASTT